MTTSERRILERSTDASAHSPALASDLLNVAEGLHHEFDDQLGAAVVDTEIHRVADQFTDAPIRAFVPLFVRRFAGDELDDRSERQRPASVVPAGADVDA